MKKINWDKFWCLLIIGVVLGTFFTILLVGCKETPKTTNLMADPMSAILKPNDTWVQKYGDSKESTLVFNLVILDRSNANQHQAIIRAIGDPNDPNSIESRLSRLEPEEMIIEAISVNDPNKGN